MKIPENIKRIAGKRARGGKLTKGEIKTLETWKANRSQEDDTLRETYPSMKALAAALEIPISALKKAKNSACPAFHASNRVNLRVLIRWLISGGQIEKSESIEDADKRSKIAQADKQELELAKLKKELITPNEAKEIFGRPLEPIARDIKDMPARLSMRVNPADPILARQELDEYVKNLCEKVRNACEVLEKN